MVQLKGYATTASDALKLGFNSFMVQLKAALKPYDWLSDVSFNSFMVQLKVASGTSLFSVTKFQFLHGTIKSAICSVPVTPVVRFQFLHGTIKSSSCTPLFTFNCIVSIPSWYN